MKFTKMEGAGNDYIYVDARSAELNRELDWPEVSRRISDRHFGVGGDGLILIKDSEIADLKMSMFNADGSEGGDVRQRYPLFRQVRHRARNSASASPRAQRGDAGRG